MWGNTAVAVGGYSEIGPYITNSVEINVTGGEFEGRRNPALLDIVEFDGFIWEPDRHRGY